MTSRFALKNSAERAENIMCFYKPQAFPKVTKKTIFFVDLWIVLG